MTYKLMPVYDILALYDSVLPTQDKRWKGFKVKLQLWDNEEYWYRGDPKSHSYTDFDLHDMHHNLVRVTAQELYVEMTPLTYQPHKLVDDDDYNMAISLIHDYQHDASPEAQNLVYLLRLVTADYD
ncbi:MAG: hypothetical protein IM613_12130 [Cytophagales bacterium]|nr:hypothetical protein [Cytophagales bacterium]